MSIYKCNYQFVKSWEKRLSFSHSETPFSKGKIINNNGYLKSTCCLLHQIPRRQVQSMYASQYNPRGNQPRTRSLAKQSPSTSPPPRGTWRSGANLPLHHPEIRAKKVGHQEPLRQLSDPAQERVGQIFQVLQEGVEMICHLGIHPSLVQGHQGTQAIDRH